MTQISTKSKSVPLIFLRALQMSDFPNWVQAYSGMREVQNEWDEGNWKESELTRAKFRAHLQKMRKWRRQDHFYEYGIFRCDDGVLVGFVSLMDVSRQIFQNAYLGYRIFNNYWGRGYATEACRESLKIAFKDLKLHRVEAGIDPKNKKSIRVARAIGLRRESMSPRRLFVNGQWRDLVLYAGTCEEFGFKFRFPKARSARKQK